MKTKIIITIITFVVLGGAVFAYEIFYGQDESEFSSVEVVRQDIVQKVSVSGSLVPLKRIQIEPKAGGEVKQVAVEVSDKVKKGDLLLALDKSGASISYQKSQSNLLSAAREVELTQTRLNDARRNLENTRQTTLENVNNAQDQVDQAEVTLAVKEQNLEDVTETADNDLSGDYEDARTVLGEEETTVDEAILKVEDIYDTYFDDSSTIDYQIALRVEAAQNSLEEAEEIIDEAKETEDVDKTWEALTKLDEALDDAKEAVVYTRNEAMLDPVYKSGIASTDKTALDTQKSNLEAAISEIVSAKQSINSQKIINQTNINAAEGEVNSAEAALASARSNLNYIKFQREEKIALAQSEINQLEKEILLKQAKFETAKSDLASSGQSLADLEVKAPMDGTITKVNIEEGESAQVGEVVVSMLPDNDFKIEADISEVDIGTVKEGNKVAVDFDAFSGKFFNGEVMKVHPTETVKEGVIYYRVEIILDSYSENLKSGLTANLEIITDQKENVLAIPYVAVTARDNKNYVRLVKKDEIVRDQEVVLGIEGETMLEVKSGLKEGDRVVTYIKD